MLTVIFQVFMDIFDTFEGHLSSLQKYILGFFRSPNAALYLEIEYFGKTDSKCPMQLTRHISIHQVFNFATHSHGLITKLSPNIHHFEEGKSIQTRLEVASFCMSYPLGNLISIQVDVSIADLWFHALLGLQFFSIFIPVSRMHKSMVKQSFLFCIVVVLPFDF